MEVGEAAAAPLNNGLGAHIDFCHFCLSLATPPLSRSLLPLHFTLHTHERAHTEKTPTYTPRFGQITQS